MPQTTAEDATARAGRGWRRARAIDAHAPPIGGFVTADGGRVHYLERGPKDAPVLVLLHGASGNLRDFAISVMEPLARDWRVIALDRPGFGHSDHAREGWRLSVQVARLAGALAALGVRRYALFGHSYSVALALDWAVRRPREVTGILAMSGAMLDWPGATGWRYRAGRRPALGRLMGAAAPLFATEAFLERELREVFAPQAPPPGYAAAAGVALAVRPATFALNLKAMAELLDEAERFRPHVRDVAAPTEVLHGAADEIIPFYEDPGPSAAAAPGAHVVALPGIGHMPHHAAPEAVLAAAARLAARL